jgi:psiF repeat
VKLISTLTLASLLVAGSAFAADAATTASKPTPASTAANATMAPVKADHHCRDDANGRKLAGAARKSFIKKCLADSRAAK